MGAAMKPILLLLGLLLAGCSTGTPLPTAKSVDLNRYMGSWYIIGEIPYFGERGDVGNMAKYTLLPDGHIQDEYFGHPKTFDAPVTHGSFDDYVVDGTGNALWRVKLFWPIYVSYLILDVDPDYKVALVGYPDRSLGWIFSRSPDMDDATYQAALSKFAAAGYDVSQFRRVAQRADQIGKPGFQ
jgi:apolipoprotein D and lipocalin family protein